MCDVMQHVRGHRMMLCVLTDSYVIINDSVDTDGPAVLIVLLFVWVPPVTCT